MLSLKELGNFEFLVTGQFDNAGYFEVTPMTRLSDLFDTIILDFNEKKKKAVFKRKN